nr:MAG TPA: hypothetical protein [Caudoviricetes sp.]DAM44935.1 MAG TPA: hypothetical protein [Caudoviricetes sp.]
MGQWAKWDTLHFPPIPARFLVGNDYIQKLFI